MTAQHGAWEGEAVRAAVRDVVAGSAPNPALQANEPTRAERERESERQIDAAINAAAKELAWAKRHSDDEGIYNRVIYRVTNLLDQRNVFVVRYEACECAGPERLMLATWHVTEAERDAARDVLVANTSPGDVIVWYTLGIPRPLRDLTDDSIDSWVNGVTIEDSSAWNVRVKRYGTCSECGRSDHPPSDSEALDRIAALIADGSVDYGEVENRIEAVLRETGRLRPSSFGPDVDRWDEDGDESEWVRSLYEGD